MEVSDTELTQFKLRISPDLKQRVEKAAKTSGRSVNRESIARLEASLELDGGSSNSTNALILTQIVRVLVAASAAAGPNWHDDRGAWELVRSTIDHILQGWEPCDETDRELSAGAMAIFEQWKATTGPDGKSPADLDEELRELELREKVIGLTTQEKQRLSRIRSLKSYDLNFKGIPLEDRETLKQKIRSEQARVDFWRRVAPLFEGPPGSERYRPKVSPKW